MPSGVGTRGMEGIAFGKKLTPFQKILSECRKSMAEWGDVPHVMYIYNCNDQYICEACRKIEGDHFNIKVSRILPRDAESSGAMAQPMRAANNNSFIAKCSAKAGSFSSMISVLKLLIWESIVEYL